MNLLLSEKQKGVFDAMKADFLYKNAMQTPKIEKIVVSVGTGKRAKMDRNWNDYVANALSLITGQKPSPRGATKSIAGFKIREGDVIGQAVTLRGEKMRSFYDKLVNVALPRTKDFRGIKRSTIDNMGNCSIGIKEHSVFPETTDVDLKDIFGMSIVIVTSAKSKKEATRLLEILGMPFQKEQ